MSPQTNETDPAAAAQAVAERPLSREEREQVLRDAFGNTVSGRLTDKVKNNLFDDPEQFSHLMKSAHAGHGAAYDADERLAGKVLSKFGLENPGPREVGRPANALTLADIQERNRKEANMSPAELMAMLTERLSHQREDLAGVTAKRGTRLFPLGNGKYNMAHGAYLTTLRRLTNLKLLHNGELKDLSIGEKVAKGQLLIMEDMTNLRKMAEEKMGGTPIGKVVNWLQKGGRLKKFLKYAAIGGIGAVAGVGVGLVTGGVGAGVGVGLGASAAVRGVRGFLVGESRHGRKLDMDTDLSSEDSLPTGDNAEEIVDASAMALGERFSGGVNERRRKHMRALGRGGIYMAIGGAAGAFHEYGGYDYLHDKFYGSQAGHIKPGSGGMKPDELGKIKPGSGGINPENLPNAGFSQYIYDAHKNPFYSGGKTGIHDMGANLAENPQLDNGVPGLHDMTDVRWVNSPEQLASVYSSMGLHGTTRDMLDANRLAEAFRVNPADMSHAHDDVMNIVRANTTHFSEVPINGPIQSEWMADPNFEQSGAVLNSSNPEIYWDNYVPPEGGTAIVMDYVNPQTGAHEQLLFRKDCGGQRFEWLPQEESQPSVSVSGYTAPVQEYSTPAPRPEAQPYVEDTPPPVEELPPPPPDIPPFYPPIIPPVIDVPPEFPQPPIPPIIPPVVPDKPPFNPLDSRIPQVFRPSPVGPGRQSIPLAPPPGRYNLPNLGGNNNSLAPGARPSLPNIPRPAAPHINPPHARNGHI